MAFCLYRVFPITNVVFSRIYCRNNMAKILHMIAVSYVGIFVIQSSAQRQICSYYGMYKLMHSCLFCPAQMGFLKWQIYGNHSLSERNSYQFALVWTGDTLAKKIGIVSQQPWKDFLHLIFRCKFRCLWYYNDLLVTNQLRSMFFCPRSTLFSRSYVPFS